MKKQFIILIIIIILVPMSACGYNDNVISQAEYDRLMSEMNAINNRFDDLFESLYASPESSNYSDISASSNPVSEEFDSNPEMPVDIGIDSFNHGIISEPFELNAGVYISGDDFTHGKYQIDVLSGKRAISIYKSYEDYINDDKGYNHFEFYYVASPDLIGANEGYNSSRLTLRLDSGMCMIVDTGLTILMTQID
jgi:hypothetical protein